MGTTIDHLRIDHIVQVTQEFTDAQGQQHRAGERGLIVALGYSLAQDDIHITWERDGQRESLHFALSSR